MHHVTAVTGDVSTNARFYTGTLGLRLVKKTVNQDDLGAYHLFYADKLGTAGTEMTFFHWPHVPTRVHGPGTIRRTLLRIPSGREHVDWWESHLKNSKVDVSRVAFPGGHAAVPRGRDVGGGSEAATTGNASAAADEATPGGHEATPGGHEATPGGREALLFSDPEGQQLALVADSFDGDSTPWGGGVVPGEHAIRGLLGAEIHSLSASNSMLFLENYVGIPAADGLSGDGSRRVFRVESDVSVAELHIVTADTSRDGQGERAGRAGAAASAGNIRGGAGAAEGAGQAGRVGIGGVHHIAFRVETPQEQEEWLSYLNERGVPNSGLVDRHYFQSLYFREPGGILFEIATAGPGFLGDEDVEHLGETLSLPPFLEPRREQIEAGLEPVPAY